MRARFFWTIFSVLTIVALGATLLHGQLIRNDRLDRIDQQVREAGTKLSQSDLNRNESVDFARVDKIVSDVLGDSRIGKLIVIRDGSGSIIFQSVGARLLPNATFPYQHEWESVYSHGKFIRILNIHLPRFPDRILQVGVVADSAFISPAFFSPGNLLFVGCIFFLGSITAWALTSTLLRPISQLVNFISSISPEAGLPPPPLPKELARFKKVPRVDELRKLIDSFSSLLERVGRGYKLSRVWSYQMAHELKTPLAIMEGEISSARKNGELQGELSQKLLKELMEASETVTDFLTWAELEGSPAKSNLYAVSTRNILHDIRERLLTKFSGRLIVNLERDFYVLSNPQHLEHLFMNLITNALQYSPESSTVEISAPAPRRILIKDHGPGVPKQVLDRIGEPFNRDDSVRRPHTKGHGLGLAYVQSVCKLYQWKMDMHTTPYGTEIFLRFPETAGQATAEDQESVRPSAEMRPGAH